MNGIKTKAVADDGISIEFLKMIFELVAEPIKHLGIVVPIPKCSAVFGRSAVNQSLISGVEDRGEGDFSSVYNVCEFFDPKQSRFRPGQL
jgi:hypothetical protein